MSIFFINNELSIQVRQFYLLGQVIITLTMNTNDKGLRISIHIIGTMVQMYINLLNVVM